MFLCCGALMISLQENCQKRVLKNTSRTSGSSHFATVFGEGGYWGRGREGSFLMYSFQESLFHKKPVSSEVPKTWAWRNWTFLHILYIELTLHQSSFKSLPLLAQVTSCEPDTKSSHYPNTDSRKYWHRVCNVGFWRDILKSGVNLFHFINCWGLPRSSQDGEINHHGWILKPERPVNQVVLQHAQRALPQIGTSSWPVWRWSTDNAATAWWRWLVIQTFY